MATYKKKYKEKIKEEVEPVLDHNIEEKSTTAEVFNKLDETASKTEAFVEKNKTYIFVVIGVAVALVLGFLGYNEFIAKPKQTLAMNDMYLAQKHFNDAITATDKTRDSLLNLALKGGGEVKYGMLDIINEYSGTPSANLAHYYAGTAYLRLKKYKQAIEHLGDFESDDEILAPLAKGNIGDAFAQINQPKDALEYYEQALQMRENEYTTPMYLYKAGAMALTLNQADKALEYFNKIKEEYPNAAEAANIDVFVGQASALANK